MMTIIPAMKHVFTIHKELLLYTITHPLYVQLDIHFFWAGFTTNPLHIIYFGFVLKNGKEVFIKSVLSFNHSFTVPNQDDTAKRILGQCVML